MLEYSHQAFDPEDQDHQMTRKRMQLHYTQEHCKTYSKKKT